MPYAELPTRMGERTKPLYRIRPLEPTPSEADSLPSVATPAPCDAAGAGCANERVVQQLRLMATCLACSHDIDEPTLLGCGCCVCRACVPSPLSDDEKGHLQVGLGVTGNFYTCPCCFKPFRFHVPNVVAKKMLAFARQMDVMIPDPSAPSEYTS